MPTYDYRCNDCGHEFELFQSMSEPKKKKCPKCKELTLQRLIGTGAAVMFKGSGFYETDYRSESYKKGAEAEKKGSEIGSKGDAAPDSKSPKTPAEKKPADKKTPKPDAKKPASSDA